MIVDFKHWGLGFSVQFRSPWLLRLWLGPVRMGWVYGPYEEKT